MKVEIWSDVMCPFCYIGKRRFETALKNFDHADKIEVVWKSFQLNPHMKTDPSKNVHQYLADMKGWSIDYAMEMNEHVTNMATEAGLEYHLDKAIVANSFDAHRVLQYAKTKGKGDELEEQLFKAYFTDGKNTADHSTLLDIAVAAGLNSEEVKEVLKSNAYSEEVKRDVQESQALGIRGVPFFVIDRKYGVSGAQASETFLQALQKAYSESAPITHIADESANACSTEGECS